MSNIAPAAPMPVSMDSKEFAALFEKDHGNVLRDMRAMLIGLYGDAYMDHHYPASGGDRRSVFIRRHGDAIFRALFEDESIWKHPPVPGVAWSRDARGYLRRIAFDPHHALTFASGYDVKLRARIVRRLEELQAKVAAPKAIPFAVGTTDTLTAEQQEQLRATFAAGAERLPLAQRGAFLQRGWSKLKAHFKVAYRQIPRHEFTEALSIAVRHVAELEAKPLALPAPHVDQLTQALDSMHLLAGSVADLSAAVMSLAAQAREGPDPRKGEGLAAPTVSPSSEKRTAPTVHSS